MPAAPFPSDRGVFADRAEAGEILATALTAYAGKGDAIVLALPRGGVPVARVVAERLSLPMDVWLVRKLGVPGHEELAMGALSMGGVRYLDRDMIRNLHISPSALDQVVAREDAELRRREALYRGERPVPPVEGKTVIVVDDGLATGATLHAALDSLRQQGAKRLVAAVPVGSADSCQALESVADEVVCPYRPEPFYGVGQWYRDFGQVSDDEVRSILKHMGN